MVVQPGNSTQCWVSHCKLTVAKHDRPIQVGSHFYEVNEALDFERETTGNAPGYPSWDSSTFEPGDEQEVTLVPLAGSQVYGFNGRINGQL